MNNNDDANFIINMSYNKCNCKQHISYVQQSMDYCCIDCDRHGIGSKFS